MVHLSRKNGSRQGLSTNNIVKAIRQLAWAEQAIGNQPEILQHDLFRPAEQAYVNPNNDAEVYQNLLWSF